MAVCEVFEKPGEPREDRSDPTGLRSPPPKGEAGCLPKGEGGSRISGELCRVPSLRACAKNAAWANSFNGERPISRGATAAKSVVRWDLVARGCLEASGGRVISLTLF